MEKDISRRSFLTGMAAIGLLTSVNCGWENWDQRETDYLFMDAGAVGFNSFRQNHGLRKGDTISFYPEVKIDQFVPAKRTTPFLKHLCCDIYEFTFRPVEAFANNLHKDCYHYLIEIWPGFQLFHFNWTEKGDNYLRLGIWYKGYGRLSNCGNPSAENPNIPLKKTRGILVRGRVERIIVNPLIKDYLENHCPWDEYRCYGYEDALASLKYWANFREFKKKTFSYQTQFTESTSFNSSSSESFIFLVKLS